MASDSFVHLHAHSEYSLLDGASRVEELCAKAAEFAMPAIALTDHGAMFGTLDFYEAARRHGIKPIVGVEAYVARASASTGRRGRARRSIGTSRCSPAARRATGTCSASSRTPTSKGSGTAPASTRSCWPNGRRA